MAQKLVHKRSNQALKAPTGATLDYGEIAVNYNVESPFLSIKNSDNTYSKFSSDDIIAAGMVEYVSGELKLKSDTGHTHDDRYYTETEVDAKIKAVNDTIEDNELTTSAALNELNERVLGTAPAIHTHKKSDITDFEHTHGTVTLTGDVTGSASFTNAGATIDATVANDSHTHGSTSITGKITAGTGITDGATGLVDGNAVYEYAQPKGNYKTIQTAVSSPSASGNATAFIDTITQNTNGVISVTKKNVDFSAYVNQNAFSNVKVGTTTVAADSATDTLTLVAGTNVQITADTNNDTITISASHSHSEYSGTGHTHSNYVSTAGGSVVAGTTNFNKIQISGAGTTYGTGATLFFGDSETEVYLRNTANKDLTIYASGTLNLNGGSVLINGYTPSRITGATGTVSNTTGTPSVSIATGGTASAQTLTFTFTNIKGAKGDKGDKGDTGSPGTNGTNGTNGKSVTQVVCTSSLTSTTAATVNTADGATNYYRFKDSSGGFITGGIIVKNGSSGSTTTTTTTDEKVKSEVGVSTKTYLLGTTASGTATGTTYKSNAVYMSGSSTTNTTLFTPRISATTITASTAFYQSDERLKDFCGEIDVDFEKLKEIPKKYYTWKSDENKELQIGTSAQKVLEVYPELVGGSEDTNYAVDYARLSIVALKAIDKLHDENQTLRDLVEKMDKRITELEEKLK